MIGKTLSHYQIEELLGAGGMGVVYRARDTLLERDVAIKVLPAGALADEGTRKQFRKEALHLSKLNHPHIEMIFELGSEAGVDFLALELVRGETLSDRIAEGPLPEAEVARLGEQLAQGLAAAHQEGILHRDIKPGNLRLTPDGRLKILDFGLAKLTRKPGGDLSTARTVSISDRAAGTLPYMPPEQLRGGPIDPRCDIYAVGAVLYEMACGRRAFPQEAAPAVIGAILGQPPTAPHEIFAGVSADLERMILRCLEKDPAHRYASANELASDLRQLALPEGQRQLSREREARPPRIAWKVAALTSSAAVCAAAILLMATPGGHGLLHRIFGGASSGLRSVAVLPLANMSGDPEQEYFSEGLTDELIQSLAQIGSLRVISRASVMALKDSKEPTDQIARRLGVDHLIEGSVARGENRVRVRAELIRVKPERVLWAKSYERETRDVLAIQSDVARAIANEIQIHLTAQERGRLSRSVHVNPEAHEAYLRGIYYWNKRDSTRVNKASQYFNDAIRIDPAYAVGWAGVAQGYYARSNLYEPAREAMPKVKAAAERALELDPDLPEGHIWRGVVLAQYEWNWSEAEREYRRAIDLNPSSSDAHEFYGYMLYEQARLDGALREYRIVEELNPISSDHGGSIAWCEYAAGKYDEAIARLRQNIDLDPANGDTHTWLGLCYLRSGLREQAFSELERGASLSDHIWPRAQLGYAYGITGRLKEARATLAKFMKPPAGERQDPCAIALVLMGLGERDQAMSWLEKALEDRNEDLLFLRVDPAWSPLRRDLRFQTILRRMNLA